MRRLSLATAAAVLLVSSVLPPQNASGYEAVSVTNGGAAQGKIVFTGTPPPPRKVIPTKDKEVCGGIREVPLIMLAPDKGVQDAFVYLKGVEKGKAWSKATKIPTIANQKCDFRPHVQIIPAGDVEIVNDDPVLHNTHGFYGQLTAFNVALPNKDQRITKPLKKSGLVRVECDAHGWMLSWIYVADNPYYAITAKDGTFAIKDLPPGQYTLVAWQEHTGEVEQSITVKAKEATILTIDLKK